MQTSYLRRSASSQPRITEDYIRSIKADTNEKSKNIRIYKTKIRNFKERLHNRETEINDVFKQRNGEQRITTASKDRLKNYNQLISQLTHTRDCKKQELADIIDSDRYWVAGELRSEILCLFQENERMKNETEEEIRQKNAQSGEIRYLEDFIRTSHNVDSDIDYLREDINELKQKLFVYKRGQEKAIENEIIGKISDDYSLYDQYAQDIQKETEELQTKKEQLQAEADTEDADMNEILTDLDRIIMESLDKVNEGLAKRNEATNKQESPKNKKKSTSKKK